MVIARRAMTASVIRLRVRGEAQAPASRQKGKPEHASCVLARKRGDNAFAHWEPQRPARAMQFAYGANEMKMHSREVEQALTGARRAVSVPAAQSQGGAVWPKI
jgi:hypothetical protein